MIAGLGVAPNCNRRDSRMDMGWMRPPRSGLGIRLAVCAFTAATFAGGPPHRAAAEEDLQLDYPWATLPGDTDTHVRCVLPQEFARGEQISWRLAAENNRTLASGEAAANGPTVTLSMRTPPVRDGVMLETSLQVSGSAEAQGGPRARTLFIMPPDPFAVTPKEWKKRNVRIYDPESSLIPRLEKLALEYEVIENPDALDDVRDGLLVIGEGVSFRDMPALWEGLNRVAASGVPVLCLSPADGTVELPGTAQSSLPSPRRVTWRRSDVTTAMHAHLAWPSVIDGSPAVRSFALRGEGASIVIDMAGEGSGWPWLEIDYAAPHGKLILCGLSLGPNWEASPTPAWLFAATLEYLVSNKTVTSGESK